jgi:tetratricopeptide (TPR) repeat protein
VSSLLPFPRNERFVGREDELQSLERFLLPSNTHRRTTIHGLGGCGKSALALEFAYRALARHTISVVFWVPVISQESLELAYREIGIRLRIPGIADDNADIKKLVKDALSSASLGNWLMVVDNADDPRVLSGATDNSLMSARLNDFLPFSDRGSILFTTRSRKVAGDLTPNNLLELKDMSKAEARQLLARKITKQALLNDELAVDELLEILTCLPLAIVQAAAFISMNDMPVSGYISLFQHAGTENEPFTEQFRDPSRYPDMDNTIAKTWHISFDQIRRQDPLAADHLSFMACIDRINIPQSILPPIGSPMRQAKALGTLTGYAFITERQHAMQELAKERIFDMHRLVHMACALWLDGHGEYATWASIAVARLTKLVPWGGHKGKKTWTMYLSHSLYAAGLSGVVKETETPLLLSLVGKCQASLGQYSAAANTVRRALSLREKTLGKEHIMTLDSMNQMGVVLCSQGKYQEAEAIHRQTLGLREIVLGRVHPDTLTSMNNLASALGFQGKARESEAMLRQTLELRETLLGLHNKQTMISMNNLAYVLDKQGKYEEAERMHRLVLERREIWLGHEDPDTLMGMDNLARVLRKQGKYEEAETICRETLELKETVLGREHPETLISVDSLAYLLADQHQYAECFVLYERACAAFPKVLGKDHPDTHSCQKNYHKALESQKRYQSMGS